MSAHAGETIDASFTHARDSLGNIVPARDLAGIEIEEPRPVSASATAVTHPLRPVIDGPSFARAAKVIAVLLAYVACMCAFIAAAYVVKSALGINLFPGHSFLHDWLYWHADHCPATTYTTLQLLRLS